MPLITLDFVSAVSPDADPDDRKPTKTFLHYLPLCFTVSLILAPHPSLLFVLVKYHFKTRNDPFIFIVHLLITYTLTFLAFTSLIVCVARDPGPVTLDEPRCDNEEMSLTEALMPDDADFNSPGKWCRICWGPKPERTHHCSQCGRCVLKMDHHCPWLGAKCIGHRTYPPFLHFLCFITLLSLYLAFMSLSALWFAFNNPLIMDEVVPVHLLGLAFAGIIFALVIGSFFCYHLYLVSTNQTTIENISRFMLLRHLPPLPPSSSRRHPLSNPPLEHELSYEQRCIVRSAHGAIRLYDVGLKRNWAQVLGWRHRWGWVQRLLYGGCGNGDGKSFPRNPRSDEMLNRLAVELVRADKDS